MKSNRSIPDAVVIPVLQYPDVPQAVTWLTRVFEFRERAPEDHMYGERQCTVMDPYGHVWTLTQSIADVDPAAWGGELID